MEANMTSADAALGAEGSVTSRPPPPAPTLAIGVGWTAWLLDDTRSRGIGAEARRLGAAMGLAAIYGLALGGRGGGVSMLAHAAGVPAALAAVALLGAPSLHIILALFDAPVKPLETLAATARALATTGIVLAGTAPAAALFVVTSEEVGAARATAIVGLCVAGGLGLRRWFRDMRGALAPADSATRHVALLVLVGFVVFAVVLAARVWAHTLPLFGGVS